MEHYSVLLNEAIESLNIKEDGIYVDATLGLGGHSSKILEKLTTGHLYSFDEDKMAISFANERLSKIGDNYTLIKSNFVNLKSKLEELGIKHKLIKPKTPRHNGKVERSHRKDQERFYYKRVFYSLEDLRNQGKEWRKEYNNFPMRPLGWLSPREFIKKYKSQEESLFAI